MVLKNNVIDIIYDDKFLEDAIVVDDTISKNEEFYREFLSQYDKVVLGESSDSNSLVISHLDKDCFYNPFFYEVIKKYNFGMWINGLLDCLLKEGDSSFDISNWNTRLYSKTSLSDIEIIRYCFSSKRFDLLKKYFESNPDTKDASMYSVIRSMNEEYRYIWLNNILGSYSSFIIDNCDELLEYILDFQKCLLEEVKIESLKNKFYISKDDTLLLVRDILRDIDSSCELVKLFDKDLENGSFIIYTDEEREVLSQNIPDLFKADFDKHENVVISSKDCVLGVCCLKEDMADVFSIVHEFMHYYYAFCVMEKKGSYGTYFSYFNEFASRFFEKYVANYLVNRGYDLDKAYAPYYDHVCYDINITLPIAIMMNFLSVLKQHGCVNVDNINSNESFGEILNNYKRLGYYAPNSRFINLYAKQDIVSKNGWCDLGLLIKKDENGMVDTILSYFISSYFSWKLNLNKENVSMVLDMLRSNFKDKTSDFGVLNNLKNQVKEEVKVKTIK